MDLKTKPPAYYEAEEAAKHKRAEAKRKLNALFGIDGNFSSNTVDSVIDDIIDATLLEAALTQARIRLL